ncbi:2Fe-2S iron-sulfur cluster binding domain-containing protein [Mangrovimicrobium sediminis]|uniref:2Fe-2S iron-sulfur cluster binding domain-containing protein n=1 Tax=Mangrovimicrobium sediminis TaxID=2562682 RepID=A0A4Z0M293_9GAMM|nr:2Fe-2S iron-sulfur cluster-binding protein [Haliea sp. SAOS-164]TGD73405.1 2Fe-2S iron-sulfur cluster binding domain-containing protein [Haliea sp. SAOS-164]
MVSITFIEPSGTPRTVEATPGTSLMEAATTNSVAGIIAECGGNCACGTCRVFISGAAKALVAEPGDMEAAMLEFLDDAGADLRLSCQVEVTEAMEGLEVTVSPEQR